MTLQINEACLSYLACALATAEDIDFMTIGAVVLLVARLIKDVPDAIEALIKMYAKYKEKKNVKSD